MFVCVCMCVTCIHENECTFGTCAFSLYLPPRKGTCVETNIFICSLFQFEPIDALSFDVVGCTVCGKRKLSLCTYVNYTVFEMYEIQLHFRLEFTFPTSSTLHAYDQRTTVYKELLRVLGSTHAFFE